jgi:hypothetical protein
MSYTLAINSSNVVGNNNNTFQYNFITGAFCAKDCELAIAALSYPNSFYNISTLYNNKTISLTFPYLATTTTLNIVLPDGFYLVSDINNYIRLQMINAGLYLVSSSGQYVYFFDVSYNPNYYQNQVLLSLVPTTVASGAYSGYIRPATGFWSSVAGNGLPTTASTPSMTFASSGSVSTLLGFATGSYPSSTSASQSLTGTLTPVGATVNALICRCNLLSNPITMPSDVLDLIPINNYFGSNITYNPSFPRYIPIRDGTYSSMTVAFQDQNFNTLYARDPNISLSLLIRKRPKLLE